MLVQDLIEKLRTLVEDNVNDDGAYEDAELVLDKLSGLAEVIDDYDDLSLESWAQDIRQAVESLDD